MATESFFSSASLAYVASAGAGKDGKAYSIKPNDGTGDFTFSRGSNLAATRVGADGLIEKGRENLLTFSNDFSNAVWIKSSTSVTSGQSGYDGSSDAWLLERTGASAYLQQTNSDSGVLCYSVYLKKGTYNWAYVRVQDSAGYRGVYFDLENATTGLIDSGIIDYNIEAVGVNGWYRCSIVLNSTIVRVFVYPSASNNGVFLAGTGSIYIQSAQLEIGLAATDYIESGATTGKAGLLEDEPRFDYSGGATCPSLLLEPSRTQLLRYTEWIGGWSDVNDATIDGVQSFTLGSTSARIQAGSIGSPSGDFVFYAVFDSADIGKTIRLAYFDGTASSWNTGSNITIDSNGRAERLISTGSNVIGNVAFYGTSTSQSFTLKYCQFEAGSYPTSYIPNHSGGTITRGADECSKTGISDLIGQTEGTIYWEGSVPTADQNSNIASFNYTTTSSVALEKTSLGKIRVRIWNSGSYIVTIQSSSYGDENLKIAFAYKSGDIVLYINGVQIGTDSTTFTFSVPFTQFNLGVGPIYFAYPQTSKPKQSVLFKERLNNVDLQTLTT
jgi:hypothetical protein